MKILDFVGCIDLFHFPDTPYFEVRDYRHNYLMLERTDEPEQLEQVFDKELISWNAFVDKNNRIIVKIFTEYENMR